MIRLQKKSNLDGKRRKVGLGAVNAAQKRTETDLNTELFFTHMFCTNLFVCLGKVFEGGKDFKNQPDEDRCTFFVALSRAKESVSFTFCKRRTNMPRPLQRHKEINEFFDLLQRPGVAEIKNISE